MTRQFGEHPSDGKGLERVSAALKAEQRQVTSNPMSTGRKEYLQYEPGYFAKLLVEIEAHFGCSSAHANAFDNLVEDRIAQLEEIERLTALVNHRCNYPDCEQHNGMVVERLRAERDDWHAVADARAAEIVRLSGETAPVVSKTGDDLLRRLQLSIDGFARNDHMSTWVSDKLHQESKAEIERLQRIVSEHEAGEAREAELIDRQSQEVKRLRAEAEFMRGTPASPHRSLAIAALRDVAAVLTDSERGMAADALREYSQLKRCGVETFVGRSEEKK